MEELLKENLLKQNQCKLLRMRGNKEKANLLGAYYSLLSFLSETYGDELYEKYDIDPNCTDSFDYYILTETQKNIDMIEKNAPKLKEIFQRLLDTYKENEICECDYLWTYKANKNKMMEALYNFFASLGDDVLKIYWNMLEGDNIFINKAPMERLGFSIDPAPIDNSCIMVQDLRNYLEFYTTVAHEMGHCYQFYLQKDQRQITGFSPYAEVTSMLFEKLFIEYLKRNHLIKSDLPHQLEDHIIFVNYLSISKAICRMLIEDKKLIIEAYDLNYLTKMDKKELEKEMISDCGYIDPFTKNIELYDFHYAIGGIISSYFFKKITDDFESGWKEFKDFICTARYLPFEEVMEKYFDVDLIENNIKTLTKSYRER